MKRDAIIVVKMNISGLEQEANAKWASFSAHLRLCNSDPFQTPFQLSELCFLNIGNIFVQTLHDRKALSTRTTKEHYAPAMERKDKCKSISHTINYFLLQDK